MNTMHDLHVDPIQIKTRQPDVILSNPSPETCEEYPDVILCVSTNIDDDDSDEIDPSLSEDPPAPSGRVRFRSRVRITSGLNRHRHKARSDHDYLSYSRSSSISGSPSSSISAPLRNETEEDAGKPGWGTLGQRVSIMAQSHAQRKRQREQQDRELLAKSIQLGINLPDNEFEVDERTPLANSASYLYMEPNNASCGSAIEPTIDQAELLARDIDLVFGPWPTRLWNHHWWWWQIEPILCCHCLTEKLEDEC